MIDQETKTFFKRELTGALTAQRKEFERFISAALEKQDDSVAIVAEQGTVHTEQLREVRQEIAVNSAKIEKIDIKIDHVQETLDEHTRILTANQESLLDHEERLTTLERTR